MKKKYESLFTPAKIGSCEIKNRFVMVPMEPTAVLEWTFKPVGYTTKSHDLLINRAKDGVGLIIPGAIGVYCVANREFIGDHPEAFEGLDDLMDEIHSYGAKFFMQMSAGLGRNFPLTKEMYGQLDMLNEVADMDDTLASASADLPNRWMEEYKTKELSVALIHRIVQGFADAAYQCKLKGVDGIDVHAIHEGYLLDQFAMPYTNSRKDEYGGSLENRLRFACEIVKAIKEKCGQDYPVILRYSVESKTRDFGKGIIPADKDSMEIGRTMEESKEAIRILSEAGYDGFNADNGTYDAWYYAHPPVYMPLNCNLEESIEIGPCTEKSIICAGRMQLDESAEAINKGQIEFVGIGRQFLADEKYLTKIREDREEDVIPCISCHLGCMPVALWKDSGAVVGETGTCALNPYTSREKEYEFHKSENPKHFAVIGGGIAGMEFALQAARRGHTVDLYEKSNRLGGVFNEAAYFSFKEKDRDLLTYYSCQIKKSDVTIHLNTEVKDVHELDADEVVIATGSLKERTLNLPGNEIAQSAIEFLKNDMPCDDAVVIIGGGLTGCEIAYELALKGKHPAIIEVMDDILSIPGSSMANTSFLRDAFDYYQVPVFTNAKTMSISDHDVIIETEGKEVTLKADTTVISIGYLNGIEIEHVEDEHVHVIGDADRVSNLLTAIKSAYDLVMKF